MNGVIILDKPAGISSNQALNRLKRLLSVSKMGFLGTLDPLATGVLPVFIGKATRLISDFEGLEKEYGVTIKLGERTDTLDAEGRIVEQRGLGDLTPERVREVIKSFQGVMEQETPSYSAAKFQGVPGYKLARKGQSVPRRVRTVELSGMVVDKIELPLASFRVTCSSGTYIRSLAGDIGEKTGVGAHVTQLERLRCGSLFTRLNSIRLEAIKKAVEQNDFGFLQDPGSFLRDYEPFTVEEGQQSRLKNGRSIPLGRSESILESTAAAQPVKIKALLPDGVLAAVGEAVNTRDEGLVFQPRKVLL